MTDFSKTTLGTSNAISTVNSRDPSTLAASAVFQGVGEDVSAYGRVGVSVKSDNATDGVLTMETSHDNVTWSGPVRTWANTSIAQPHMWNIVEKYFRIKYTNGTTEATNLSLQTQYSTNIDIFLGHQLDATLLDETEAIVTRSVGVGKDPNGAFKNFETSGVDSGNSSTTNLTSGTSLVFTGDWQDISSYAGLSVLTDGTASGTVGGTLQMQFSKDGSTVHRDISVTDSDITNVPPRTLGVVAQFFRVIFTADSDLTSFVIQTMVHLNQVSLVSRLDQTLQGTEDVTNVRSAIVGKTDGGVYNNVGVDGDGFLHVSLPMTAFGDLRTAELSPIIQVTFDATVTNTEIGTITTANTGAVTQENSLIKATTGATTASTARWATTRHAKYRSGFGGLNRFTAMFTTGVSGTEQAVGLSDVAGSSASHKNGYAVGYNGATFSFLRWNNDVLIPIAQSAWDDPMDGTGPSGMTLDPTKLNVYYIEFQYLGAGAINLWIESDLTGKMILAHTIQYVNQNTVPSVRNPNFNMMIHAINSGTTSVLTVFSGSMSFFVEGKSKYTELQQPQFSSGKKQKTSVSTTEVALFTIRNKTTYNSLTNYIDIFLENAQTSIEASSANNLGQVRLVKNATLGGTPSYSDINTTDSVVEIDVAGTTVTGGKEIIFTPLAGKNDRATIDLTPYEIILGPGDTLTAAALSANSSTINAGLLWKELF